MSDDLEKTCFLCKKKPGSKKRARNGLWFDCPRCGTYWAERKFMLAMKNTKDWHRLSGVTREMMEWDQDPPRITLDNYKELESLAPEMNDVATIALKLLRAITRRSTPGVRVQLMPDDFPLAFAKTYGELGYYVDYLSELGFIHRYTVSSAGTTCIVKPAGWQELRRLPGVESDKAFVAMSFDDDLRSVYENAILPAIKDCRFKPIRIDYEEYLDRIDDRIIAEIKEARFLVADFTQQKRGVYFEAGMALGREIPVIWMCQKDDIKNAHFDTRQFNHITWKPDDLPDLRQRLAVRIRATVGIGSSTADE